MLQRVRVPAPPLSDFVALLWLYDGWSVPHAKERALPDGSVELVINLREDETRLYDAEDTDTARRFSGTVLCGPHSRSFVIDTAEQASVAGVHFRPGGAFPFLGMPADELAETHVSLETLWGGAARELRERVLAAPTADARLDALEETLKARLASAARHPAVAFALSRFRANPHAGAVARRRERDRPVAASVHRGLPARGGADAEALLPRAAVPAGAREHPPAGVRRVGGRRGGVRVLRPGAFHPRFPGVLGDQSDGVPGEKGTAPESRAGVTATAGGRPQGPPLRHP